MLNRKVAAVVAVGVLAVTIGACSSSSGGSDAGSTWKLGQISSCTGTISESMASSCKVIQAWAKTVNDAGGINGHKVQVITKDDQGNPTVSLAAARTLVEHDHIIAIVAPGTQLAATWASYVQGKGIPVVGGDPVDSPYVSNPDFYSIGTNLVALNYAVALEAQKAGVTKLGFLYCAESPTCAQAAPLFKASAEAVGATVPVVQKIASNAPDYTAPCLALKNSGVQMYEVGASSPTVLRVLDACAAQGLRALIATDGTFTADWAKDKNTEGTYGVELTVPWFDSSLPAMQQFVAALKKYAPGIYDTSSFGPNTVYAWDSGKLFEAAAKAGKLGDNPKPADLKRGLYALKGQTLGGLTAPLTFQPDNPGLNTCYFTVAIKNQKFVETNGVAPQCIDPAKLAPFL
jgi:branched-chain amino acid transport system substrate-binding protein